MFSGEIWEDLASVTHGRMQPPPQSAFERRVSGGLTVIGAGVGFLAGAALCTTGIGCVIGGSIMVASADVGGAGAGQLLTGSPQQTVIGKVIGPQAQEIEMQLVAAAAYIGGLFNAAGVGGGDLSTGPIEAETHVYRGVHAGHPAMKDALVGRVVPGNPAGTVTAEAHNLGGMAADSPFTSWTHSYEVALDHALKEGPGGVILRLPTGAPPPGATWSWVWSPDEYVELEVLLFGVREGATVLKP
jgi:hypothetical protein